MIERSCLIIDNEDQSDEIEKLVRDAGFSGILLDCQQFNVGSTSNPEFLTGGLIDIKKVIEEFKRKFKNKYFDIVAFDWDLEDEDITGVELIRHFTSSKILKFSPKIVYSGVIDEVLTKIVEESLDIVKTRGGAQKPVLKQIGLTKIKSLIKNGVLEYLDRGSRDAMILKFLKENLQSTELIISQVLRKHPEFKFENNFVNTKFNGKTFQELADVLENAELLGTEFKREIIQQVISYLTEKI